VVGAFLAGSTLGGMLTTETPGLSRHHARAMALERRSLDRHCSSNVKTCCVVRAVRASHDSGTDGCCYKKAVPTSSEMQRRDNDVMCSFEADTVNFSLYGKFADARQRQTQEQTDPAI
jgi:hypothetical protein